MLGNICKFVFIINLSRGQNWVFEFPDGGYKWKIIGSKWNSPTDRISLAGESETQRVRVASEL